MGDWNLSGFLTFLKPGGRRQSLSGFARLCSVCLGTILAVITFYTAVKGVFPAMIQRGVHLSIILALVFLWYPANPKSNKNQPTVVDWVLVVLSLTLMVWIISEQERMLTRIALSSPMKTIDYICSAIMVVLVIESARRTVGMSIVMIALTAIAYALFGAYLPGAFRHKGFSIAKIIEYLAMTTNGIPGSLVGSTATTLFCFVAFGCFLQMVKADRKYMDMCLAAVGKSSGGPAKVAVLSSALFGSISGSTIANVVATGTLTIPMMKKIGYSPEEAGAVETAASAAGQIMPPIMGTSIFIMCELVGMKYGDIVRISYLPAILYFSSVWFFVGAIAKKRGIRGFSSAELPKFLPALKAAIPAFIPIFVLLFLLAKNYTAFYSGFFCVALLAVIGLIFKDFRYSFRDLIDALEKSSISMCSVTATSACASIVVALVNKTGLMLKTTSIILSIAGTSWFVNILLVALVAYIMGMGLPVSSAYVILAVLAAPAMIKIGIPLLIAHMVIQWFTQLATVTPPVCITAYAAAGIAGADPMKTGFSALKMASGFYFIPILFLCTPLLEQEGGARFGCAVLLFCGIYCLISALEGVLSVRINAPVRIIAGLSGLCFVGAALSVCPTSLRPILVVCAGLLFFGAKKLSRNHASAGDKDERSA